MWESTVWIVNFPRMCGIARLSLHIHPTIRASNADGINVGFSFVPTPRLMAFMWYGSSLPANLANNSFFSKPVAWSTGSLKSTTKEKINKLLEKVFIWKFHKNLYPKLNRLCVRRNRLPALISFRTSSNVYINFGQIRSHDISIQNKNRSFHNLQYMSNNCVQLFFLVVLFLFWKFFSPNSTKPIRFGE